MLFRFQDFGLDFVILNFEIWLGIFMLVNQSDEGKGIVTQGWVKVESTLAQQVAIITDRMIFI